MLSHTTIEASRRKTVRSFYRVFPSRIRVPRIYSLGHFSFFVPVLSLGDGIMDFPSESFFKAFKILLSLPCFFFKPFSLSRVLRLSPLSFNDNFSLSTRDWRDRSRITLVPTSIHSNDLEASRACLKRWVSLKFILLLLLLLSLSLITKSILIAFRF